MEVSGASDGWIERLAGVRVVERLATGAVLELADGASEQVVLDGARAAGEVTHFSVVRPSLRQLLRAAVGP